MGKAGSARARSGDAAYGSAMSDHEERLDFNGTKRRIREVPPLIYSPHTSDHPEPLDRHPKDDDEKERLRLAELERIRTLIEVAEEKRNFKLMDAYAAHVEGAKQSKAASKLFLHAFVQFPTDIEITPESEVEMLAQAVAFINRNYGGNAVFHARLDRDEKGRHGVDVFYAPRYEKTTAKGVTEWISLSKFSKEMARDRLGKRQKTVKNKTTGEFDPVVDEKTGEPVMLWNDSGYFQGRALQDAWHEHLRDDMGLEWAERGKRKKSREPDRVEPEEYAAEQEAKKFQAELEHQLKPKKFKLKHPTATFGDEPEPETPPKRPYEDEVGNLLANTKQEALKAAERAVEGRMKDVEGEAVQMRSEAQQELSEARRARSEAEQALDFERDQARMEVEAANTHGITDYRSAYRHAEERQAFRISSLETKLATAEKKSALWEGSFQILIKALKAILSDDLYQSVKQIFDPEFDKLKEDLSKPPEPKTPLQNFGRDNPTPS